MNLLAINFVALAAGALAIFLINGVWFGPKTFYPVWWRALGKEVPEASAQDNSAKSMVRLFGSSMAAALAQSLVLTLIVTAVSQAQQVDLALGALIGLAFAVVSAGASLPHRLFGQQGFKVWLIEIGADTLALVAAGCLIALIV